MKFITFAFLFVLTIGAMAQDTGEAALHKQLFDLKSTLDRMKVDLMTVNKKLSTSEYTINGDAIRILADSINAINDLRIDDSIYFEQRLAKLQIKTPNPLNKDATYQAYVKLDSLRTIELKLLTQ